MKAQRFATKVQLRKLSRKTEAGFEQLQVTSAAALKLALNEIRRLKARVARLERKTRRRR